VRPPVLEGTARPATAKPTADKPAPDKPAPEKPAASKPAAPADKPATAPTASPAPGGGTRAWLAGLGGGLVGLGAAYGLAWFGLWPTPPAAPPQPDPRIAPLALAVPQLETNTETLTTELAGLGTRLAALEAQPAPDGAAAPAAVTEQLASLTQRLAALETAPAATPAEPADATALTAELDALRQQTTDLAGRLDASEAIIAGLGRELAARSTADDATARLPLIVSGLESTFATGRPFASELAALRRALPEAGVPEALAARAETGLPRPDAVAERFAALLPAMLAGRPAAADASWQDATADWFRGLLALRPAGPVAGDSPDAIMARLEAALAQRDFAAARAELASLPAPMQQAAGPVAADIAALAGAEDFLAGLRATALGTGDGA